MNILDAEGSLVNLANGGQVALNLLESQKSVVDIVIVDVQMSVMNGYEATRRVRNVAVWEDLPVVALISGALLEHQELAGKAGMSSFVANRLMCTRRSP